MAPLEVPCLEPLPRPAPDQQVASAPDASSSRMPGRATGPRRQQQPPSTSSPQAPASSPPTWIHSPSRRSHGIRRVPAGKSPAAATSCILPPWRHCRSPSARLVSLHVQCTSCLHMQRLLITTTVTQSPREKCVM
ncbi:SH3 and multiple ankyrin repeat domains protein 1-like [Triticum dicoccoides]|nr:SH3 and multiple ankyrin repeat domains protein 1-like [Triticum dicoccoides]